MTRMHIVVRSTFFWAMAGLFLLGAATGGRAADGPMELAGIRLGLSVDALADKLVTNGADRALHQSYLGVVPVAPVPGYRSGYVEFGLCAAPGRIVRIKMNYADDSLPFFNRIMEALKARYGEPKEWRGNAFGTLRTWKWGLKTSSGQPVSLILMHYEGEDGAFTEGNSLRIAATGMVREEEQCHAAKLGREKATNSRAGQEADMKSLGLDCFLPR